MSSTVGSHIAHKGKTFNALTNAKQIQKDGFYKSGEELTTYIDFVSTISSNRTIPVAARWNSETKKIEINLEQIQRKYEEKAWMNPAILSDGS
jgi:hypothetical protein